MKQTVQLVPDCGIKHLVPYLWLVGNGRMVVIVVIIVPSLLTKGGVPDHSMPAS